MEKLTLESRMEVPGIESLEHLRNLRELKLGANKLGPSIERYIQRMQGLPSERTIICARAVPHAASLVQSLLSPNLEIVDSIANHLQIVDSISNQKLQTWPRPKLMRKRFSHGEAVMLCFVINCVSSKALFSVTTSLGSSKVEKGRWAWVGVFTRSSRDFKSDVICFIQSIGEQEEEDEVEKGFAVMGEERTLMEAFRSLLPLFIQS